MPGTERPAGRRRLSWMRALLPLAILAGAVGVLVLVVVLVPKRQEQTPPVPLRVVPVEAVVLEPVEAFARFFILNGEIQPDRVVRVSAEVAGVVEGYAPAGEDGNPSQRPLREGDRVQAGQPLMTINTDLLQADYDRAQAELQFQQSEYERISGLAARGAASDLEARNTQMRLRVAQATYQAARTTLSRSVVNAQAGGVLNRLPVEVGEFVSPGQVVAEIVDSDLVKVIVDVPERESHHVRVGDEIEILRTAGGTVPSSGRITFISELADEAARTTRVEATVPNRVAANGGRAFRSGQIVTVRLMLEVVPDAIVVPLRAVTPLDRGRHEVFVVEDGVARRREVELGIIRGTQVQIRSGLGAGDVLIVMGHNLVGPGQPVAVQEPSKDAGEPGASPAADGQQE